MNKKVTLLAILVAVLVLAIGYFYLGGLNKVNVSLESVSDYNLVGVHFEGMPKSDTIEMAFFQAREYVQNNRLDGVLALIHYNDTTLAKDRIKLFIGVHLNKGTSDIPEEYERLTIPAKRTIRATIEAHNVVMPSPKTIESKIKEMAEGLNLKLQDFTIERYLSERELLIEMPVR